jgi:cytochrome c-type biogenesis protein CcmH
MIYLLLLFSIVSFAQTPPPPDTDPVTRDEVNAVAERLYCPVCEMEPLDTCMAPSCVEWRAEIRNQLENGQSDDQVVDYFISVYGNQVVGIPDDGGLQLMSFAGPIIGVLLAFGLGFYALRKREDAPQPIAAPPANEDDDDYRSQLETDLNA